MRTWICLISLIAGSLLTSGFSWAESQDRVLDPDTLAAVEFCDLRKFSGTSDTESNVSARFSPNSVLCFYGQINDASVDELLGFIERVPEGEPVTLVVRSQGGAVNAGIRAGKILRAKKVSVVVDMECNSSCANYFFLPAQRKIVLKDALVLFHGGISPGFIESMQADLRKESKKRKPDPVRMKWLPVNISDAPAVMQSQARLLESAGVDPKFFEFFDKFNRTPIRKRDTACIARKVGFLVFSEAYLKRRGVEIDLNLGPKSAEELSSIIQKWGGDPKPFCFWDQDLR